MITRENKLFRLSWLKSNLFRATSTETAYNARMLENETGQDMFDRYAMTIDERPFFDEHIAQALLALLHHFRRIVPDCQPITTEGDACGLTFAARVSRDEDEFYSHAELQGVERSATEILRYYILAEWYLSIRANDLWTAYTQKTHRSRRHAVVLPVPVLPSRITTRPSGISVPRRIFAARRNTNHRRRPGLTSQYQCNGIKYYSPNGCFERPEIASR